MKNLSIFFFGNSFYCYLVNSAEKNIDVFSGILISIDGGLIIVNCFLILMLYKQSFLE